MRRTSRGTWMHNIVLIINLSFRQLPHVFRHDTPHPSETHTPMETPVSIRTRTWILTSRTVPHHRRTRRVRYLPAITTISIIQCWPPTWTITCLATIWKVKALIRQTPNPDENLGAGGPLLPMLSWHSWSASFGVKNICPLPTAVMWPTRLAYPRRRWRRGTKIEGEQFTLCYNLYWWLILTQRTLFQSELSGSDKTNCDWSNFVTKQTSRKIWFPQQTSTQVNIIYICVIERQTDA